MATKMFAPSGTVGIVQSSKGGNYTIGSDGSIQAATTDVDDLLKAGFTLANRASNSANGLASTNLPLTQFKNADGTTLAATAASGKFGLAITLGTSEVLTGEAANNNTKTDTAMTEIVLPPNYVAGQDITLTVSSRIVIGSGTAGATKTLTAAAYKKAADGTQGANLIATAAATLTNAIAENAFTITGTTLSPGDVVAISLAAALAESASSNINAQINSARIS